MWPMRLTRRNEKGTIDPMTRRFLGCDQSRFMPALVAKHHDRAAVVGHALRQRDRWAADGRRVLLVDDPALDALAEVPLQDIAEELAKRTWPCTYIAPQVPMALPPRVGRHSSRGIAWDGAWVSPSAGTDDLTELCDLGATEEEAKVLTNAPGLLVTTLWHGLAAVADAVDKAGAVDATMFLPFAGMPLLDSVVDPHLADVDRNVRWTRRLWRGLYGALAASLNPLLLRRVVVHNENGRLPSGARKKNQPHSTHWRVVKLAPDARHVFVPGPPLSLFPSSPLPPSPSLGLQLIKGIRLGAPPPPIAEHDVRGHLRRLRRGAVVVPADELAAHGWTVVDGVTYAHVSPHVRGKGPRRETLIRGGAPAGPAGATGATRHSPERNARG